MDQLVAMATQIIKMANEDWCACFHGDWFEELEGVYPGNSIVGDLARD